MKRHTLSEDAFKRIKASMDTRKTMREVAEAILLTEKWEISDDSKITWSLPHAAPSKRDWS
jgi:hypothetical protein